MRKKFVQIYSKCGKISKYFDFPYTLVEIRLYLYCYKQECLVLPNKDALLTLVRMPYKL